MQNDTHKPVHDFIVKHSPSVCVAIVASLTGELADEVLLTMLMEQQTVTNPAVIHGFRAMTKHYISNACSLRVAPPPPLPDDKSSY